MAEVVQGGPVRLDPMAGIRGLQMIVQQGMDRELVETAPPVGLEDLRLRRSVYIAHSLIVLLMC